MSVHDAEPGDIYIDEFGKLWRVYGTCKEPTVMIEEIEKTGAEALRRSGGVSGLMWDGFKRIHRPEKPAVRDPTNFRADGKGFVGF